MRQQACRGGDKRRNQHAPALGFFFCCGCSGTGRAYTVKGNAIKCFRSLDYELQIALSGFKWRVFFPIAH